MGDPSRGVQEGSAEGSRGTDSGSECDVGAASRAAGSHDQETGTHYRRFMMGIDSGEGSCPRGVLRLNVWRNV